MKSYESIPVSKTEIDGVVEDLCIEPNYEIEYLSDHLDDGKTWRIKPILSTGEVNLETFAQQLRDNLNVNEGTDFSVQVVEMTGGTNIRYITIEKLTNE